MWRDSTAAAAGAKVDSFAIFGLPMLASGGRCSSCTHKSYCWNTPEQSSWRPPPSSRLHKYIFLGLVQSVCPGKVWKILKFNLKSSKFQREFWALLTWPDGVISRDLFEDKIKGGHIATQVYQAKLKFFFWLPKMSDKRRRRRRASGESSEDEEEDSVSGVIFNLFSTWNS